MMRPSSIHVKNFVLLLGGNESIAYILPALSSQIVCGTGDLGG
jgi:hypothetical protein